MNPRDTNYKVTCVEFVTLCRGQNWSGRDRVGPSIGSKTGGVAGAGVGVGLCQGQNWDREAGARRTLGRELNWCIGGGVLVQFALSKNDKQLRWFTGLISLWDLCDSKKETEYSGKHTESPLAPGTQG